MFVLYNFSGHTNDNNYYYKNKNIIIVVSAQVGIGAA